MSTVIYYDPITGETFDHMPSGKVKVSNADQLKEPYADDYKSEHATNLPEIIVTPEKQSTTMAAYYDRARYKTENNFLRSLERDAEDNRIRKANHWEGVLNYLSPSQYVGAFKQDEVPWWESVWYGNAGLFSNDFAKKHPLLSTLGNGAFDILVPYSARKFYKYVSRPIEYSNGVETVRVWSPHMFSREVLKEYPKDSNPLLKSNIPETIQMKYKGTYPDGNSVFSQKKVKIPKELDPIKMRDLNHRIMRNSNFRLNEFGDMVNDKYGFTDRLAGNIGEISGKYFHVDPSYLLPIEEYNAITYKKGGVLKFENSGVFPVFSEIKPQEGTFYDKLPDNVKIIPDYNSYQDSQIMGLNAPVYGDLIDLVSPVNFIGTLEGIGAIQDIYDNGFTADNVRDVISGVLGVVPIQTIQTVSDALNLLIDLAQSASDSSARSKAYRMTIDDMFKELSKHKNSVCSELKEDGSYTIIYPTKLKDGSINYNVVAHKGIGKKSTNKEVNEYLTKKNKEKRNGRTQKN